MQLGYAYRVIALALFMLAGGCGAKKAGQGPTACDHGSVCRDSDCDTICDLHEGGERRDTDKDGVPDYLDEDADGDGVPDAEEAGDDDPKTPPLDSDADGLPDFLDASYPLQGSHPGSDSGPSGLDASFASDAAALDGSGHYDVDASAVDSQLCPDESIVAPGCLAQEPKTCDGLDNDCDGTVDEGTLCSCKRGEVRKCFRGPPGRRGVGACEDGIQVCEGDEFPSFGPCKGGREPSSERCDGLDDDCNGCTDELDGCKPKLSCPSPGDPRIADAKPFAAYVLDASKFYAGSDATAFRWTVRGSPCDRLFGSIDPSATSASGKLSYTLVGASQAQAQLTFTLSGAYEITLEITTPDGVLRCTWTLHVRAPGVRVELCWDKTGPKAAAGGDAVDLDLHLGKHGQTSAWSSANDCYWDTCRGDQTPWSYANTTPASACTGTGAQNYAAYDLLGFCPNPRLDFDNRLDSASEAKYLTENANFDNPQAGDVLRVMVHYNTNVVADAQGPDAGVPAPLGTHPLVNVYCGGELAGSFGGDPEASGDAEELSGFDTPGQMWRVVDITAGAQGCTLTPLGAPAPASGYWVSDWDPSFGN